MPKVQPVEPTYVSQVKSPIHVEQTIATSPEIIWKVISDNNTWPKWFPEMSLCETTSKSTGLGSTRRVKQSWWVSDERIICWEPNRAWGYTLEWFNFPIFKHLYEQIELDESSGGTTIRYTGAYEAHWLVWAYSFFYIRSDLKSLWEKAFKNLEQYTIGK